jgi:hypothetical protein
MRAESPQYPQTAGPVEDEKKERFRTIPAADAVEDDPSHHVLKWIIENKKGSKVWRDQVVARIEATLEKGIYDGWEGWETYIRKRVDDGFLEKKCKLLLEEGRNKRGAKKTYEEIDGAVSPLSIKNLEKRRLKCDVTGVHNWKTEGNGAYARKDAIRAYTLTGVVCDGEKEDGTKCGKEFVEKVEDAIDPTRCYVISQKSPCEWCMDCHLALCLPCHGRLLSKTSMKRCCRPVRKLEL